jgi:hypothetical protein
VNAQEMMQVLKCGADPNHLNVIPKSNRNSVNVHLDMMKAETDMGKATGVDYVYN